MKVLLSNSTGLADNGISTFIINNAKIFASKPDMEIGIAAPNEVQDSIKKELKAKNITLYEFPYRNSNPLKYFVQMRKMLKKEKYDIVHVNGSSNMMAIELAAAYFAGVKVRVAHSHNTVTEHIKLHKLLAIPFNQLTNVRLACNEASGKWLFGNKKFTVIDNGIFLEKYLYNQEIRQKIRNGLGISKDEILLGHVGHFSYQKNQEFLVNLTKKLPSNYKLLLIGDGHDFEGIEAKVKKLALGNRVYFTGTVSNVPDYLSAMDIFLLPSRFEGQPFVIVEASANGLPIIVSDKVSLEANLTGKIRFLPLIVKDWIREISCLNYRDRQVESHDNCGKLASKGYDIYSNVDKLYSIYKEHLVR